MSHQRRKILAISGSALVTGLLILAIIVNAGAINRQLHSWKLLPEPERLTELYFTDHKILPTTYLPATAQTVAFTIHNLEYRTTSYHYVISQRSNVTNQSADLASGNLTLKQDQYSKQSISVTLNDLGESDRSQVSVSLSPGNETINYLVTRI